MVITRGIPEWRLIICILYLHSNASEFSALKQPHKRGGGYVYPSSCASCARMIDVSLFSLRNFFTASILTNGPLLDSQQWKKTPNERILQLPVEEGTLSSLIRGEVGRGIVDFRVFYLVCFQWVWPKQVAASEESTRIKRKKRKKNKNKN